MLLIAAGDGDVNAAPNVGPADKRHNMLRRCIFRCVEGCIISAQ